MSKATLVEKILARASGREQVAQDEIVSARVDRLMVNDFVGPTVCCTFEKSGLTSIRQEQRVTFCMDHFMPPTSVKDAESHKLIRSFCRRHSITHCDEIGRGGISHQVMVEGAVRPGEVAVGTDSHATMYGALGAFSCGITASDAVVAMSTGQLWLRVPGTVRVDLTGKPCEYVTGKDIALQMLSTLGTMGYGSMAIEIGGEALGYISMDSRLCIANMLAETNTKAVIIEPDEKTAAYMGMTDTEFMLPDSDARYERSITLDVSGISPLVACPDSASNVHTVDECAGIEVDQVFLGSCTNGRIEDLRQAAQVMRGKKVHESVRMIVVPASRAVLHDALNEGIISELERAGAAILTPSCAACAGTGAGAIGSGEVCVSTTNRNFPGRMGAIDSKVYLASAYTAAQTAITGRLCAYKGEAGK